MKVRLTKEFLFEASHRLDHLPKDHPCFNLHGHSYRVEIEVSGEVNEQTGFLIDYSDIKAAAAPIIKKLDHCHLNDIPELPTTTTEHIARWLWQHLKPTLPILTRITIYETHSTSCTYEGE